MNFITKSMMYLVWLAVFIAVILVVWFFLIRKEALPEPVAPAATSPEADMVTTQPLTNGNKLITNSTAKYEAIVPASWYLEKKEGSGVTFYPNYDPAKKAAPTCKIEVSLLENSDNADFDDWLTSHLHEDPTADVTELSRVPSTVSGHPVITWSGMLNGVSSTLGYISREDGSIYEIAPSVIQSVGSLPDAAIEGTCSSAFQSLMTGFRIMP